MSGHGAVPPSQNSRILRQRAPEAKLNLKQDPRSRQLIVVMNPIPYCKAATAQEKRVRAVTNCRNPVIDAVGSIAGVRFLAQLRTLGLNERKTNFPQ